MHQQEALSRFPDLREGMVVRGAGEEKLGRILRLDDTELVVERGLIFPKELHVAYDDIWGFEDGEVRVNRTRRSLEADETPARQMPVGAAGEYAGMQRTDVYDSAGLPPLADRDIESHPATRDFRPRPTPKRVA